MTSIRQNLTYKARTESFSETDINGCVYGDDLLRLALRTGKEFKIANPHLNSESPLIKGRFHNFRCHSGLAVHATDTVSLHDLATGSILQPRLSVAVILEGTVDLELGSKHVTLGNDDGPAGHLWMLTRKEHFRRTSRKGARLRKVIVTLPPSWLTAEMDGGKAEESGLQSFFSQHLALRSWTPSEHILKLAEQVIALQSGSRLMRCMAAESKAIEIVMAALDEISAVPTTASEPAIANDHLPPQTRARAERICAYLLRSLDRQFGLDDLASELGLSVASMQRAFKAAYGCPISEFLREYRLLRARDALQQEGVSVSEAAYRAGYNNPANFATAFRKRFSIPPSSIRG